jgi:hypothetical protein
VTPKKVQKKRGGQRKHWAEKARVWVWYCYVKGRSDYSDYALDNEFAWTENGKASRSNDDDRPRTFECIRKFSRKPAGRDPRWRDINELVLTVDQAPIFNGTRAVYMSKFWYLLQEQSLTISSVQLEVEQILETNRLVRIDTRKSEFFSKMIDKHGQEYVFDRCLELSLNQMNDELSGIVLTWLLYLQTEPIHNLHVRKVIESIADNQLDVFFGSYYTNTDHLNNYSKAIDALLNLKLDMSETNMGGYGFLETYGVWPIIPLSMIDTISEKDLFSINFKPLIF